MRPQEDDFAEIEDMIDAARGRSLEAVRATLDRPDVAAALSVLHPEAASEDARLTAFLELSDSRVQATLHGLLLQHVRRQLMAERQRLDFAFIDSSAPLHGGGMDVAPDLLFLHRGLRCLVAIELVVGAFQPAYLANLERSLEALDRDVRNSHEEPSIGVLLCTSESSQVVEYALPRGMSPLRVAECLTQLPQKAVLQARLQQVWTLLQEASRGR